MPHPPPSSSNYSTTIVETYTADTQPRIPPFRRPLPQPIILHVENSPAWSSPGPDWFVSHTSSAGAARFLGGLKWFSPVRQVATPTLANLDSLMSELGVDLKSMPPAVSGLLKRMHEAIRASEREEARLRRCLESQTSELTSSSWKVAAVVDEARALLLSRGHLLSNISHDLKTSLTGIFAMTELLAETGLSSEQREWLSLIKRSSKMLLSTTEQVAELSDIEIGKRPLFSQTFSILDLLSHVTSLYAVDVKVGEIEYLVHVEESVPEYLIGDPERLQQILFYLVNNAIKFTPLRGGVVIHVLLSEQQEIPTPGLAPLHFVVADTGMGIPPEELSSFFDALTKEGEDGVGRFPGKGIGLTICHKLVHVMGGNIWVRSIEGVGTAFHFTLTLECDPLLSKSSIETVPPRTLEAKAGPSASLRLNPSLKVLIADENTVNRMVASGVVQALGWRPTVVSTSHAAVEAVKRDHFDIIVFDCGTGDPATFLAMREIRGIHRLGERRVPIVGLVQQTTLAPEELHTHGVDICVTKPFQPEDLQSTLVKVVNEFQLFGPCTVDEFFLVRR